MPLELTVLGTSGAWPEPGRACSGFVLRSGESRLVLDLGFGTLPRLLAIVPAHEVRGVVVSHAHADHCVDLFGFYRALRLPTPAFRSPPVFAASDVIDRVGALDGDGGPERLRQGLDVRPIGPAQTIDLAPFRITTFALPHFVPNVGVRVEADGQVVAYTGDTGPSDVLDELARDADLFVCEAMYQAAPSERDAAFLLTARAAGEYARRARARELLLTHFWPGEDRATSRSDAQRAYPGPVRVAEEGMTVPVGRRPP